MSSKIPPQEIGGKQKVDLQNFALEGHPREGGAKACVMLNVLNWQNVLT